MSLAEMFVRLWVVIEAIDLGIAWTRRAGGLQHKKTRECKCCQSVNCQQKFRCVFRMIHDSGVTLSREKQYSTHSVSTKDSGSITSGHRKAFLRSAVSAAQTR